MNLADRLSEHARSRPRAVAVIEGDRSTDFHALDAAAWRAAAWLRGEGIRPGDVVALAMGDSTLHLVAGLALARMGAVQLGLMQREPAAEKLRTALRHSAVAVLAGAGTPAIGDLRHLHPDPAWLDAADAPRDDSLRASGGDRPWIITRTSGTTGLPKAVLQSHDAYAARRELGRGPLSIGSDDRYLAALSMDFSLGYKLCLDALWVGASVITGRQYRKAGELVAAANSHQASYLYLTPSYLHWLAPKLPPGPPQLPRLRVLRSGTMAMPESVRQVIVSRLTPNLLISYGIADIDCGVTQADADIQARFPGSVGTARPGVELEIERETGEVRIRVPLMPAGYIDDPEASARAFRGGWFYPGDLGLLTAEGVLYLKGRADELMNCEGIKVLPSQIEEVLLAHPAVAEAAAFPVESERHQHLPAAAVVLRAPVANEELLKWCRERLGPRSPQAILELRELPRNELGKVRKNELAERVKRKLK